MNSSDQPSIFTAKDSLKRKKTDTGPAARDYARPLPPVRSNTVVFPHRTGSPHRRVSTPEYVERKRLQAQLEEDSAKRNIRSHHSSIGTAAAEDGTGRANSTLNKAAQVLNGIGRVDEAAQRGKDSNTEHSTQISQPWVQAHSSEAQQIIPAKRPRSNSAGPGATVASSSSQFLRPAIPASIPQTRGVDKFLLPLNTPNSEPAAKKLKLKPRGRHILDGISYLRAPSLAFQQPDQPPSPLFFSSSPRPRPQLPPRFSSSEAAAKMLGKARAEETQVKTVSLARGLVSTTSYAASPTSAPRESQPRQSLDRSSTGRSASPDFKNGYRESSSVLTPRTSALLGNIGIVELLEQDERPTFIVDLTESSNYGAGPLHPVFANSSLRSYGGMWDLVTGDQNAEHSPGPNKHLQFKSWLLSAAVNGESLNVCLPAFSYAGLTWSCSTVRKRLRIISAAFTQTTPGTSGALELATSIPPPSSSLDGVTAAPPANPLAMIVEPVEPSDYFGAAASPRNVPQPKSQAISATSEIIPTIERPPLSQNVSNGSILSLGKLAGASSGLVDFAQESQAYSGTMVPAMQTPLSAGYSTSSAAEMPGNAPSFDWTRLPLTDSMPSHIKFARSIDWASTSLGPIEDWSSDLRQMCNLIMASPHPAAMYWGEDLIAIYNEAYILLAGQKHPWLMGRSYRVAWAEIWDDVKDVFASARLTGEATMKDDDCLFIKRSDYLEETYFSWSIIPMVGNDGTVMGLYNPAFEKTRRKIAERRMLTLREVGERTASARDVKGFWKAVLESFEFNEYDSPFLLLYSVTDESDSDSSSIHSGSVFGSRQCFLEGALGVPEGHPAAAEQIDLKSGMEGLGPVFREIMKIDKPVLLEVGSRDLPATLFDGVDSRGFGDPVRAVVICPIHPTTGDTILGFLVLGVNPRRPYDDDYSLFVQLLCRQLATSLASVVLFEEEIRRGQRAAKLAALDRIELSEQLAARTQEAIESETKFTRMAEFAPVGMFITGSNGNISFANDAWYELSRVPKDSELTDAWMESVHDEDKGLVKRLWDQLVIDTKPVSSEFRFKADWTDQDGKRTDTWVLFSAFPERYPPNHDHESIRGKLKSIFGVMTNISQQKWAEGLQRRRMEEAWEMKRQQENFIDITSHEMRNPLSAILQCSDEITRTLTKYREEHSNSPSNGTEKAQDADAEEDPINNCLDAAQTINLCSQHQKRIVDDILTLSKLDSQLLLVTPVDAQPLSVVQRALKMHEGELLAADIQMRFVVDQTFRDMDLDWVRFDPSRVLQVLINLTTNAIKFTTTESKRTISVTIAACKERPSIMPDAPVSYFPSRNKKKDIVSDAPDWGDGEKVYIHFAVRDTGRGLNPEEKKLLFLRFSQASPRTHVQYGGSGLGLFISRELTELQGGEIGVESEAGKGSTFAFYVVARKIRSPTPSAQSVAGPLQRTPTDAKGKKDALAYANGRPTKDTRSLVNSPKKSRPDVLRVLIVEDNLVNQRVLQKQLKQLGTIVHLANHGGEALEKLRQSTYWAGGHDSDSAGGDGTDKKLELGVVLMDQEMPVMDGLTCTRKIRELESEGKLTGHVPIIAVTANARNEQVQTALDAGMDDIICKPFKIPDLVPKIEELAEKFPMPQKS